jgi:hypothetical protein
VTVVPLQIVFAEALMLTIGVGSTCMIANDVSEQVPLAPVTVYVIVFDGVAVTVDPVVADKPVDGDQL